MAYTRGLHEIGDGLFAYLQPDGGWGWSNAGLVVDGEASLLVDTLFDLRLTREMLAQMRRVLAPAGRIDTLVNTHGDSDHCYGNQLLPGARIVASERTAAELGEPAPQVMAALVEQAPSMGALGEFFLECFGAFDFRGIEVVRPQQTFSGELELSVGSRVLRLIEVGPAHTAGDTLVHAPAEGVLFSGDILFAGAHPVVWAGPVSNWIAACERILALGVARIVPGHGPLAGPAEVRELKAYLEYLYERARELRREGRSALEAARAILAGSFGDWRNPERLVVNVANIYAELYGEEPLERVAAFEQMAELARER